MNKAMQSNVGGTFANYPYLPDKDNGASAKTADGHTKTYFERNLGQAYPQVGLLNTFMQLQYDYTKYYNKNANTDNQLFHSETKFDFYKVRNSDGTVE